MGLLAFPLALVGAENHDILNPALAGSLIEVDQNGHPRSQLGQLHLMSISPLDTHILPDGKDFVVLAVERIDAQDSILKIQRLNFPSESLLMVAGG